MSDLLKDKYLIACCLYLTLILNTYFMVVLLGLLPYLPAASVKLRWLPNWKYAPTDALWLGQCGCFSWFDEHSWCWLVRPLSHFSSERKEAESASLSAKEGLFLADSVVGEGVSEGKWDTSDNPHPPTQLHTPPPWPPPRPPLSSKMPETESEQKMSAFLWPTVSGMKKSPLVYPAEACAQPFGFLFDASCLNFFNYSVQKGKKSKMFSTKKMCTLEGLTHWRTRAKCVRIASDLALCDTEGDFSWWHTISLSICNSICSQNKCAPPSQFWGRICQILVNFGGLYLALFWPLCIIMYRDVLF